MQGVALVTPDEIRAPFGEALADLVAESGGILRHLDDTGSRRRARPALRACRRAWLDLDLHVDESLDPGARSLRRIAEAALRNRFEGKVLCGHCCSLSVQPPEEASATLELVREAGIAMVGLPMCNLYLQDRAPGRTPRRRGATLLHEIAARGIAVALASDNCRDPFFAYGDHDVLEVFREAVRISHLDRPVGAWPAAVTRTPAGIMGLQERGRIVPGVPADLVLFRDRGWSELLSRPQADRVVLRAGRPIDRALPGYRELDGLS